MTVQVVSKAANSFSLGILGYATSRSLTKFDFQFKTASDVKVAGTQFTVSVLSEAALWYNSTSAQAFGGQFLVTIPFTLQSDTPAVTSTVDDG